MEGEIRSELDAGRAVYVGDHAFAGSGKEEVSRLGERLLRRGKAVGSYEGAGINETIYVVGPEAADF
jgi:hypothetical protein